MILAYQRYGAGKALAFTPQDSWMWQMHADVPLEDMTPEMRAEMDVIALISNCPQLNNPCNGYNPTPVRVLIWD